MKSWLVIRNSVWVEARRDSPEGKNEKTEKKPES